MLGKYPNRYLLPKNEIEFDQNTLFKTITKPDQIISQGLYNQTTKLALIKTSGLYGKSKYEYFINNSFFNDSSAEEFN
jgi:hypothetical protein